MNVPFENLDIHLAEPRPIVLDEEAFFDKIVRRRRGGYCYELNGLFAAALRHLGYDVTLLSARSKASVGNFAPEFDHMALLVRLEEPWLVDVGFGDCFRLPLRLNETSRQNDGFADFRIEPQPQDHFMLLRSDGAGGWSEEYLFNRIPRRLEDFEGMNRHHQRSPSSPFTRRKVITRTTPDGRITLAHTNLIVTRGTEVETRPLAGAEEVLRVLREEFGIEAGEVPGLR